MPADRIVELYERHAHAFDLARRAKFVERGWLDRFRAPLPPSGAVLDLGCGAGEPIARHLIDRGHALTGVDSSARMIALARTRFPRHHWQLGDMRTAEVAGAFDGVLAWDSLFHLPHDDQAHMLRRVADWLRPGGSLLFNSGPARGEAIGSFHGEPLYHASLDPAEYRALFAQVGLAEIAYVAEDAHCGGRSVWLARKRKAA